MAIIRTSIAAEASAPDRNKTELTLRTTEAAAAWLHALGAKAVETEVPVARSWIADLVAFWAPTVTEATQQKLILPDRGYHFKPDTAMHLRWIDQRGERLKAYRALPERMTILHEVKTTRADFLKDRKFQRPAVADMHVLSYTRGILKPEEVPLNWWLLEHAADGSLTAVKRRGPIQYVGCEKRLPLIAAIAERRHNRTANAFWNDLQRTQKEDERQRRVEDRVETAVRAAVEYVAGEHPSMRAALERHFPRTRIPESVVAWCEQKVGAQRALEDVKNG